MGQQKPPGIVALQAQATPVMLGVLQCDENMEKKTLLPSLPHTHTGTCMRARSNKGTCLRARTVERTGMYTETCI